MTAGAGARHPADGWTGIAPGSREAGGRPPEIGARSASTLGRGLLFVAGVLLAWVSTAPFPSLADAHWLDADTGDLANQVAWLGCAVFAALVILRERQVWPALLRPVYGLMIAWLAVSVATSAYPALSARRLAFALCVVVVGAAMPLLPPSRARFADYLAGLTAAVLALCFAGVLFVPDLAVHQVTDLVEPRLAGNWRGIFAHKNMAGEMMGMFVFVGLFVARVRSRLIGWAIVAAALAFLAFTEAKSAIGFLPLTLALAWVSRRRWAVFLRVALFLGAIGALNTLSVGSLSSPGIASITAKLVSDPTFTGRTEIWQVALDWIPKRPVFGYGYGAFWQTGEVTDTKGAYEGDDAARADHAHNAVLNLAVTTGIPGAAIALLWALVLPLKDLGRCLERGSDPALANLFLRIWLFAIANCSFESILFARGDPMWFTMLVAMFGLRYLGVLAVDDGEPG